MCKFNGELFFFHFCTGLCKHWAELEHGTLIIPTIKRLPYASDRTTKKVVCKTEPNANATCVRCGAVSTRIYILCNAYALNSDDVLFSSRFRHFARCCCFSWVNFNIRTPNNKHSMALRCAHARIHRLPCVRVSCWWCDRSVFTSQWMDLGKNVLQLCIFHAQTELTESVGWPWRIGELFRNPFRIANGNQLTEFAHMVTELKINDHEIVSISSVPWSAEAAR